VARRVAAAGGEHRAFPPALEFDATAGRAMEEQWSTYLPMMFWGTPVVEAVRDELADRPADVVVVDQLLRSTAWWVSRQGPPLVLLVHMAHRYHGAVVDPGSDVWGLRWQYDRLAETFAALGASAPTVPDPVETMTVTLARSAAATVVALPHELDPWPGAPTSVVHVGLLREQRDGRPDTAARLWSDGDERPLVVVSLGTTYMHQEAHLERVCTALGALDVRVLVLTGDELGPGEVAGTLGPDVRVLGYVPLDVVLLGAGLMVCHAGAGTMLEAMVAGVPAAYLPLGRDQHDNAVLGEELGVGVTLADGAEGDELVAALASALGSTALRDRTVALAGRLSRYDPRLAAAVVEGAAGQRRTGTRRRSRNLERVRAR
jgi:UDP:flavonoid glycosyltransferase YjiC (YdhE family)